MNKQNIIKFLLLLIAFTFALSANYLFAAWSGPTQAPTGGNTPTPVHVGATDQVKDGGLSLDALAVFGRGYFQGSVQVGNSGANPQAGEIRWNGSDFEGYNGNAWVSFTADTTGGGSVCPEGQDMVTIGSSSVCLADGATAGAGCTSYATGDYAGYGYRAGGGARYKDKKIQVSASLRQGLFEGEWKWWTVCNTGWADGFSSGCTGTGVSVTASGVSVSLSYQGATCSSAGVWQ